MSAPETETPYTETEVLLAVMNDDEDRMHTLVNDMMPGEVATLYEQVNRLRAVLWTSLQNTDPVFLPETGTTGRDYRPRHVRRG